MNDRDLSHTLEAYFCYDDYRDDLLDEMPCVRAPVDGDWSSFSAMAELNEDDIGTVVIRRGDDVVEIEDSLIATIQNICLGAVPKLIDTLGDKEFFVAIAAHQALKNITGQDFGFKENMSRNEVRKVQSRARDWWKDHENDR